MTTDYKSIDPSMPFTERYQRKLGRFVRERKEKVEHFNKWGKERLVSRILYLEDRIKWSKGKIGNQATRINGLKETVEGQERIIKVLRQQIALLRKAA